MSWGLYGLLVVFGLFIILMILNPSLSCFGKRIKSPFYPLLRKKKKKEVQTEDYSFFLVDDTEKIKQSKHKDESDKTG